MFISRASIDAIDEINALEIERQRPPSRPNWAFLSTIFVYTQSRARRRQRYPVWRTRGINGMVQGLVESTDELPRHPVDCSSRCLRDCQFLPSPSMCNPYHLSIYKSISIHLSLSLYVCVYEIALSPREIPPTASTSAQNNHVRTYTTTSQQHQHQLPHRLRGNPTRKNTVSV